MMEKVMQTMRKRFFYSFEGNSSAGPVLSDIRFKPSFYKYKSR